MSDIAIKVQSLSKCYLLGHNALQAERYTAMRDVIARNAKNLVRKTTDMMRGRAIIQGDEVEEFWALKNVSFEIKQGEVVGIIGRNGAGKSTLLKILSRITEPTEGRVAISGRVASLLEVGTGFHPELSGRENIFLNGAILGMQREEIRRKFDEIVDFAGIEKFLDTPVKRYSSGMYVRLAFSVAAHLEPEILVVDEVLAVGDSEFQKRCLGKMQDVASDGRTVLFVSHNLGAVQTLCNRALHLRHGQVHDDGNPSEVVQRYLKGLTTKQSANAFARDNPERQCKGNVWFTDGYVLNADGHPTESLIAGETAEVVLHYESLARLNDIVVVFTIFNSSGVKVSSIYTTLTDFFIDDIAQRGLFRCTLPKLPLAVDDYTIAAAISVHGEQQDMIANAMSFSVVGSVFFGTSKVPEKAYATVYLDHSWSAESVQ